MTLFTPARRWPGSAAPVSGVLTTDGPIFRRNGQPWRYAGVTAFKLCERFRLGESIDDFLDDYAGYNVLRVFSYTPVKDWGHEAWAPPDLGTLLAFLSACAARDWVVEFVLLTDDDPAQIDTAQHLIEGLAAAQPTNLILEIGNEPTTHKTIITEALHSACEASGFLYSSGEYEDSSRFFGKYLTFHSARTEDWPRRAHDALEYYHGGGPNAPSDPAHHVPCVGDEPAKLQDVAYNVLDWRAYFGACAILGAGATFHSETGKLAHRPTMDEVMLAAAALEALLAFPPDAPFGQYRRIVEPNQPPEARTYVVGNYMVRCQQIGSAAPEPGWTAIDADGVLWSR